VSRDGTCFTKTCHYHAFDQEAGLGCDGHGQFPAGESAYRKRHSTETVMIRVLSDALMAADRQQVTLLRAARLVCSIRLRRSHSSAAATGPPVWSGRRGLAVDEIVRQRSDATSLVRRTTVISATTPIWCTTRISPRSTALCYVHCRASPSGIKSWSYLTSICRRLPSVPFHVRRRCT